jgi:hypothetical protein
MIQLIKILVFLVTLAVLLITLIQISKALNRRTILFLLLEFTGLVVLNWAVSGIIKYGALAGILLVIISILIITLSIFYLTKNIKNKNL